MKGARHPRARMHNARGGCNNLLHLGLGRGGEGVEGEEGQARRLPRRENSLPRSTVAFSSTRFSLLCGRERRREKEREIREQREKERVGVKRCWNVWLLFSFWLWGNVKFLSHWLLFLLAFVMENITFLSRASSLFVFTCLLLWRIFHF